MLDIKLIRKDRAAVEAKVKTKDPEADLSQVVQFDTQIREKKTRVEQLKSKRNEASTKIGELKRQKQDAKDLMDQVASFADEIHQLDHEIADLEKKFTHEL